MKKVAVDKQGHKIKHAAGYDGWQYDPKYWDDICDGDGVNGVCDGDGGDGDDGGDDGGW